MAPLVSGLCSLLLAASPATAAAHAEVVAQHVVALAEGTYRWVATPVEVAAEPTPGTAEDTTFLAVIAGGVTVADDDGAVQYALEAGEATILLPGTSFTQWASVADQPSELWRIRLAGSAASGADGEVGEAFTLDAGDYDLELIHDVLGPAEVLTLPASVAPTLLRADGNVLVTGDSSTLATDLAAGTPATFPGALTVVNLGDLPVSVLATSISPAAGAGASNEASEPHESSEPPESNETGAPTSAPTASSGSASTTVTPTSSAATPTSSTSTTAPAPGVTLDPGSINTTPSSFRDSDNDYLSDAEEAALGTDPNNYDSDGDIMHDATEVAMGTDPTNPDSDGDGFDDGFEDYFGTGPLDASNYPGVGEVDTDGDRYSDNVETLLGYNPNDPASHP